MHNSLMCSQTVWCTVVNFVEVGIIARIRNPLLFERWIGACLLR